ncbi:hypothetical protein QQP08_001802 [Theobroma cacao]|nr:hypothetical protein QQP08_001802 [Theobroma cacao]
MGWILVPTVYSRHFERFDNSLKPGEAGQNLLNHFQVFLGGEACTVHLPNKVSNRHIHRPAEECGRLGSPNSQSCFMRVMQYQIDGNVDHFCSLVTALI